MLLKNNEGGFYLTILLLEVIHLHHVISITVLAKLKRYSAYDNFYAVLIHIFYYYILQEMNR